MAAHSGGWLQSAESAAQPAVRCECRRWVMVVRRSGKRAQYGMLWQSGRNVLERCENQARRQMVLALHPGARKLDVRAVRDKMSGR
jgi:hypothetical protein